MPLSQRLAVPQHVSPQKTCGYLHPKFFLAINTSLAPHLRVLSGTGEEQLLSKEAVIEKTAALRCCDQEKSCRDII